MYSSTAFDQLLSLEGKVSIITGSAAGIGKAIAKRLHQAGAKVVIADINEAEAVSVAGRLNNVREKSAVGVGLDVSKGDQVKSIVERIMIEFGGIDILVNNAGIFPIVPLYSMSKEDFMRVIDINMRGVFLCTKIVSEKMKQIGKGGNIINITSIDALHPSMIGLAHYDASKHGVWGFTKSTALELAQYGIAVNAIAPGGILTPGIGSLDGEPIPGNEVFIERIPMGRMGHADEIGKVCLFLASDMSSYMTGEQIVVDGGRLLG